MFYISSLHLYEILITFIFFKFNQDLGVLHFCLTYQKRAFQTHQKSELRIRIYVKCQAAPLLDLQFTYHVCDTVFHWQVALRCLFEQSLEKDPEERKVPTIISEHKLWGDGRGRGFRKTCAGRLFTGKGSKWQASALKCCLDSPFVNASFTEHEAQSSFSTTFILKKPKLLLYPVPKRK